MNKIWERKAIVIKEHFKINKKGVHEAIKQIVLIIIIFERNPYKGKSKYEKISNI